MEIRIMLTIVLLTIGFFFLVVPVIGMVRYRDFFSRLQVLGVGQSLGIALCCTGLAVYEGLNNTGIKILMIVFFMIIGGPVGTHIIDKVAYKETLKHFSDGETWSEEEK